ncbi:MAG: UDP-2,3-diacylglucosamine diphosphatase [Rikenellaceae bacterium]|jgi:UDP-2,3-diacylglucosamine hydrolase|nr:UDP-2,3-diacylglucosamine diphosphatase [Rikenellaceae bacterium]
MAYYFASDVHLGFAAGGDYAERERRFVAWLRAIEADAEGVFLAGDIFDFWFEYRRVAPKGFSTVFSQLAHLTARGIPVHFFPGNHDMWTRDFFRRECGMTVHHDGDFFELAGKRLYVAHGDRPDDYFLAIIYHAFRSRFLRGAFATFVHPDWATWFGRRWSGYSRARGAARHTFGGETEHVVQFAHKILKDTPVDYFVFGHLHIPAAYALTPATTLFVLGDWIGPMPVYGRLDPNGTFSLAEYR